MKTDYQDFSNKGGVYQIKNLLNGRLYFGSAKEFKERYKGHISSLRNNKHRNKFLQNDFNKCGTDAFVFEVVEVVEGSIQDRLLVEQKYIDQFYDSGKQCYNSNKIVSAPYKPSTTSKNKGIKFTEEHCKRISEANLGKFRRTYHVELMSPNGVMYTKIENIVSFVKEHGLSLAGLKFLINGERRTHKGWRLVNEKPPSTKKDWSGINSPSYGRKHTEETKKKIGDLQRGLSWEDRQGKEASDKRKQSQSKRLVEKLASDIEARNQLGNKIRGKSLEELYGFEKAQEIKKNRSKSIAKKYSGFELVSPDGTIITEITNFSQFCKSNKLDSAHLRSLIKGTLKTHKGWRCSKIKKEHELCQRKRQ
jgi:group I intron endonuclease